MHNCIKLYLKTTNPSQLRKKKLEKLMEARFRANLHFWARLPEDAEEVPVHISHLRCRDAKINDVILSKLVTVIHSVDMFDLDDNEITNEGINYLKKLESIKELRLKECRNIDNGCLKYLNQITSLELVHLGSTGVTIDGLYQLKNLVNLKTLLVSADEEKEIIREKLSAIANDLPYCEFIVNHKVMDLY